MKIVVLDGHTLNPGDNPWTGLQPCGAVEVYSSSAASDVVARSVEADVLVINKVRLDRTTLGRLPQLKMIAVTATGYDCVDVHAASELGITVSNVPVYGTDSVAQHVFALLLHVVHRVDLHDAAIHDGEWARQGDFSFCLQPLIELAHRQMGIIGFGKIGRRVAELARAFGMRVMAHAPRPRDGLEGPGFAWGTLDELLSTSDIVSLHCPLAEGTRGLINRERLALMKSSAILLNTGRGALVVEADLADALNEGRIRAVASDVASTEPISSDNPLLTARNCFLTPHHGWATLEARQRLMSVTVQNVAAFAAGKPQNVVSQR